MAMEPTLLEFIYPLSNDYKLYIEDDGKTAYAYLIENGKFISDVWLYNVVPSPYTPEWQEKNAQDLMPFTNSVEYLNDEKFELPTSPEQIGVDWEKENDNTIIAKIFIRDELHAIVSSKEKIGHCKLVRQDGPLARIL